MKQPPSAAAPPRASGPRLALVLAAVALSAAGGWTLRSFWQRLPWAQAKRLSADPVRQAFVRQCSTASAKARQATILADNSRVIQLGLRGVFSASDVRDALARTSAAVGDARLFRIQQAAVTLLELEQHGAPAEQWWDKLQPYLEGLETASCAHLQPELVALWAASYRALGVAPGAAYQWALVTVRHPHGPFLQFVVERLGRVAETLRVGGNAAEAKLCERIVQRLLRQWVLEPASPGLRLLAADLLVHWLAPNDLPLTDAAGMLAAPLQAWRESYRQAAAQRPIDLFGVESGPATSPAASGRLFTWAALSTWTVGAALGAALLAVLTGGTWLARRGPVARPRELLAPALLITALLVLAGWVAVQLWPATFRQDFRRDWSRPGMWWRHPLVAGALVIVMTVAAALVRGSRNRTGASRPARVAAHAVVAWAVLAGTVMILGLGAGVARTRYDQAVLKAAHDEFAEVAGPEADHLLDGLRAWEP